ncbi:hypothetical protein HK102_013622 [Quaeritorhiza haematococci]|nr:hypothetical protein HK102_013622 [Quaeritorhiza haematococci]
MPAKPWVLRKVKDCGPGYQIYETSDPTLAEPLTLLPQKPWRASTAPPTSTHRLNSFSAAPRRPNHKPPPKSAPTRIRTLDNNTSKKPTNTNRGTCTQQKAPAAANVTLAPRCYKMVKYPRKFQKEARIKRLESKFMEKLNFECEGLSEGQREAVIKAITRTNAWKKFMMGTHADIYIDLTDSDVRCDCQQQSHEQDEHEGSISDLHESTRVDTPEQQVEDAYENEGGRQGVEEEVVVVGAHSDPNPNPSEPNFYNSFVEDGGFAVLEEDEEEAEMEKDEESEHDDEELESVESSLSFVVEPYQLQSPTLVPEEEADTAALRQDVVMGRSSKWAVEHLEQPVSLLDAGFPMIEGNLFDLPPQSKSATSQNTTTNTTPPTTTTANSTNGNPNSNSTFVSDFEALINAWKPSIFDAKRAVRFNVVQDIKPPEALLQTLRTNLRVDIDGSKGRPGTGIGLHPGSERFATGQFR